MNHTIVYLRAVLAGRNQRGASAVEWVLISALLIGVAIAVGAIILAKLTGKANDLDLG